MSDLAAPPGGPAGWWHLCEEWLRRSTDVISQSAEALNTLNVFPISDADTGSNLRLTLLGVAQAVHRFDRPSLDEVVQAAILSAHGNSGAIVAEMFARVGRTLQAAGPAALADTPGGELVARLMRTVASAATEAVARPVGGTIVTVAEEAASAAEAAAAEVPRSALRVATRAQASAAAALARTPEQLDVLGEAGVVDAGGQAFVLLVDVLVEVLGGPPAQPLLEVTAPRTTGATSELETHTEYEVMYALRGVDPDDLAELRDRLLALGTSVVVAGDGAVAQVHVHLADAGAAVEVALPLGQLSQIRVTALSRAAVPRGRTVLCLVAGPGLATAVAAMGGLPVLPAGGHATPSELSAAIGRGCEDLVILPNDMECLEVARHLARTWRMEGRRVAVIPTVAQVQGLAAMAVHEPTADFDSAVVAMSTAGAHARQGAVTIAEAPTMTMAGRCEAGDVLGVVEGDFVEVGSSLPEVGWRVIQRLLSGGGELLTLVGGAGVDPAAMAELASRGRSGGVDVEVVDGGQPRYQVLIGVE